MESDQVGSSTLAHQSLVKMLLVTGSANYYNGLNHSSRYMSQIPIMSTDEAI